MRRDRLAAGQRRHGAGADTSAAFDVAHPDIQGRAAPSAGRRERRRAPPRDFVSAAFARGLDHPRWLYVLPNGDVLVAETNAPPKPDDGKGIQGLVMKLVMKRAGAGDAERQPHHAAARRRRRRRGRHAHRVPREPEFAVRHGAGRRATSTSPTPTRCCAFPYTRGRHAHRRRRHARSSICRPGPINHHWTKNVIASADGTQAVRDGGLEQQRRRERHGGRGRARRDLGGRRRDRHATRIFASGLRNPNGLAWEPQTGALWTAVNERDELGSDLVPDYLTSVRDGGFYGWPYSYYGQHVDARVKPQRPDLVATAIAPDYALGPHTASLGLASSDGASAAAAVCATACSSASTARGTASRRSGYKVIFVPFANGKPSGMPVDVLTGFLDADGQALGRPVGVASTSAARCWSPTTSATSSGG